MNIFRIFKERRDLRERVAVLENQNIELHDKLIDAGFDKELLIQRIEDDGKALVDHGRDIRLLTSLIRKMQAGEATAEEVINAVEWAEKTHEEREALFFGRLLREHPEAADIEKGSIH